LAIAGLDQKGFDVLGPRVDGKPSGLDGSHIEEIAQKRLHGSRSALDHLDRLEGLRLSAQFRDLQPEQLGSHHDHAKLVAKVVRHDSEDLLSLLHRLLRVGVEPRILDRRGRAARQVLRNQQVFIRVAAIRFG
jgi:hypothetical protein